MKNFIGVLILMAGATGLLAQAPDTLWTRTYGGFNGLNWLEGQLTTDGGFIIIGSSHLLKTDSNGNVMWERDFDECPDLALMWDTRETQDRGFVSFGTGSCDAYEFYLTKTDSSGESVWSRRFGSWHNGRRMDATVDGGFILVGSSEPNVYVIKTNSSGVLQWERTYAGGAWALDVKQTLDGGYVIAGWSNSFNQFYGQKIDSLGNVQWADELGVGEAWAVTVTSNGDYVFAGRTAGQMRVIKTNTAGDTLWTRMYSCGLAQDVIARPNGDLVIVGGTCLIRTTDDGSVLWTKDLSTCGINIGYFAHFDTDGGLVVGGQSTDLSAVIVKLHPEAGLVVRSPNGGEVLHISSYDTIRWLGVGFEGGVHIELNRSYPSGAWEVLADSTENDGEFEWFVTDPLSDNCRIRVSAVADTFSDISDGDFSIVSSQGYLALVRTSAPNNAVLNWNAGEIECPLTSSATFRLKNFGSEAIVVFQPLEPASSEFSRATNCGGFFALAPGQMSACSLTLAFDPASDGTYHDTLLIQTDAVNQQGGYVRIPLSGEQISTPATPQVVIDVSGEDAVLHWDPVTQSVGGCPVAVTRYLVFYSPTSNGPFYYHGWTADTTYTHDGVITYASGMFYEVIAMAGSVEVSRLVRGMTREEVEESILPYRQKFGLEN